MDEKDKGLTAHSTAVSPALRAQEKEAPVIYKHCCVRDGKFVEPCSTLLSVLGPSIRHEQWMNFVTGKPTLSFIVIRSGQHKKAGVIMNRCPFCGENIGEPIERRQQEEDNKPRGSSADTRLDSRVSSSPNPVDPSSLSKEDIT